LYPDYRGVQPLVPHGSWVQGAEQLDLMVVGFREQSMYHLDASIGENDSKIRKRVIGDLGVVLSHIISHPKYPLAFRKKATSILCFRISDAKGLPSCQPSLVKIPLSILNGVISINPLT
ncbi:hypothetical protein HN873_018609, partial [Arachis hypogaea]